MEAPSRCSTRNTGAASLPHWFRHELRDETCCRARLPLSRLRRSGPSQRSDRRPIVPCLGRVQVVRPSRLAFQQEIDAVTGRWVGTLRWRRGGPRSRVPGRHWCAGGNRGWVSSTLWSTRRLRWVTGSGLLLAVPTACDPDPLGVSCPGAVTPAVVVEVLDSATGAWIADSASVEVSRPRYVSWSRDGVEAEPAPCVVATARIVARLQQAPWS